MNLTKECPKCGATMWNNKGISAKTGKAYENWKCKACGEIEWIPQDGQGGVAKPALKNEATELLREIRDLVQLIYDKKE